jgi:NAD(P)-dependent dehydrogenase (short-subunit alcohol dehydrogenase family)
MADNSETLARADSTAEFNPAPCVRASTAPMRSVDGKVAVITGGDSGIGLGIARAFFKAGMKLVITYRTRDHLDRAIEYLLDAPERVHAIPLDVTDRAAVVAAAEEVVRVFGKVHVLVNNAGVAPLIPLSNATFDDWDWCMDVNVNGVFNGIRAFLPLIKSSGEGGHIVATSSILGGVLVGPFWGVYSTSKFAVVGMMEALRSELVDTNIGVSVFCPGGVNSDIKNSDRNRPVSLADKGVPDMHNKIVMDKFNGAILKAILENGDSQPIMDPLEAGERVLSGIKNNDLYIFSHPEYERAIRDRNEALLASIPSEECSVSETRIAIAQLARNRIYQQQGNRKASAGSNPEKRRANDK